MARRPLEGKVSDNVLKHGCGALNIDGCRVGPNPGYKYNADKNGTTFHGKQGQRIKQTAEKKKSPVIASTKGRWPSNAIFDDEASALLENNKRFFYCAKASPQDREEGNNHPTVKPTDLMRYLCRLVTPPGGTIFDPFMGSGSTGKAALLEDFKFIGIDIEPDYVETARSRLANLPGKLSI